MRPVRSETEVTFRETQLKVIAESRHAFAKYCWSEGALDDGVNFTSSSPALLVGSTWTFPGVESVRAGFASIGICTWVDVATFPPKETEALIDTLSVAETLASFKGIGALTEGDCSEPASSAGTEQVTVWLERPVPVGATVQEELATAVARSELGTVKVTTDAPAAPPKLLS